MNAHGIDPTPGPIAPTVKKLRVMLSDGSTVTASRTENEELFRHALGGYGLFGVILDVDLDVVPNEMYERQVAHMDYKAFPKYYRGWIESNEEVGLRSGRLSVSPGTYLRETAVHVYTKTPSNGTLAPLEPGRYHALGRFVINFSKTGGIGRWFRWTIEKHLEPRLHSCLTRNKAMGQSDACLVTRNQEMYDDTAYLKNRLRDTDLQEYFVPYDRMPEFVDSLRETVQRNRANVKFNGQDNEILKKTTAELIDAAHQVGGEYYLPYQLFYSRQQLEKADSEFRDFLIAKKKSTVRNCLGINSTKLMECRRLGEAV